MPQTVLTYADILATCKLRVADTSTAIADSTTWYSLINDACQDIIDECIYYKAYELLDCLHEKTTITLVADQEEYGYYALVAADSSKKFGHFVKAMWGDQDVRVVDFHRYQDLLQSGAIPVSEMKPFMCFVGAKKFKLRPIPTGNDTDNPFIFYYIQRFTKMSGTSDVPLVDHRCVPLIYPAAASKYWERRRQFDLADRQEAKFLRGVAKIIKPFKKYPMYDVISVDSE